MKRTILSLVAAAAVGTAGLTAVPRTADAQWWIAPAIIAGVVGGVAVGSAIQANAYPYDTYGAAPRGTVYVRPTAAAQDCQIVRERMRNGSIRRVQVCD
jgi:hypothetical protein